MMPELLATATNPVRRLPSCAMLTDTKTSPAMRPHARSTSHGIRRTPALSCR